MDLPVFKSAEDQSEYAELFEQQVATYERLFHLTKQQFFPGYYYERLDGRTLHVLREITTEVMYNTTEAFEKKHPEYKKETDVFIPRSTIKETVKEAFDEYIDNISTSLQNFTLGDA